MCNELGVEWPLRLVIGGGPLCIKALPRGDVLMAWIYERKWVGIRYTPFDFENERFPGNQNYVDFRRGIELQLPLATMSSARQKKQTNGALPDILTVRTYQICNKRFKEFVEHWEPDLHFFKSFSLKRKNGDSIGDHFLWTVGQDVDCVLTDNLGAFWDPKDREFHFDEVRRQAERSRQSNKGPLVQISKPAIAGRHLWTAGLLAAIGEAKTSYFFSDEFHAAYKQERFTGLEFVADAAEINVPWVAKDNMGFLYDDWRVREVNIRDHWPDAQKRHGGEVGS